MRVQADVRGQVIPEQPERVVNVLLQVGSFLNLPTPKGGGFQSAILVNCHCWNMYFSRSVRLIATKISSDNASNNPAAPLKFGSNRHGGKQCHRYLPPNRQRNPAYRLSRRPSLTARLIA